MFKLESDTMKRCHLDLMNRLCFSFLSQIKNPQFHPVFLLQLRRIEKFNFDFNLHITHFLFRQENLYYYFLLRKGQRPAFIENLTEVPIGG